VCSGAVKSLQIDPKRHRLADMLLSMATKHGRKVQLQSYPKEPRHDKENQFNNAVSLPKRPPSFSKNKRRNPTPPLLISTISWQLKNNTRGTCAATQNGTVVTNKETLASSNRRCF